VVPRVAFERSDRLAVTGTSPHLAVVSLVCDTAWHELIVGSESMQMPCLMPGRKAVRIVVSS